MSNTQQQLPDGLEWPKNKEFAYFSVLSTGEGYFFKIVEPGQFERDTDRLFAGYFPALAANYKNSLVIRPENQ